MRYEIGSRPNMFGRRQGTIAGSYVAFLVAVAICGLLTAGLNGAAAAEPTPRPPSTPSDTTLDGLLEAFRRAPGVEAHFTEEKRIALLALPLESTGTIYFAPPGRLARYQTAPNASFQIVEPHRVRFGDDKHSEAIDLAQKPVVKVFVDSFVTLISGDSEALHRLYAVEFQAPSVARDGRWQIVLRPKVAPMNKVIASITLGGVGLLIATMTIAESEGDETVTTFSDVNVRRTFTSEEQKRIFRLPTAP